MNPIIPPLPSGNGIRFAAIPLHPGYAASDDGRIWTCWRRHRRDPRNSGAACIGEWRTMVVGEHHGAPAVKICGLDRSVASLVLRAFTGPPPSAIPRIVRLDGDRRNVALSNLRWSLGSRRDSGTRSTRRQLPRWLPGLVRAGLVYKDRECLGCGKTFESDGPGNRFCGRCQHRNDSDEVYERPRYPDPKPGQAGRHRPAPATVRELAVA